MNIDSIFSILTIVVFVITFIFGIFLAFILSGKYRTLLYSILYQVNIPPVWNVSYFDLITMLINRSIWNESLIQSKILGPVFCFPSIFNPLHIFVIVGDRDLAKSILIGDSSSNKILSRSNCSESNDTNSIPPMEKSTQFYNSLNSLSFHKPNLLTRLTASVEWQKYRKAVSLSFSMTSLQRIYPLLQDEVHSLCSFIEDKLTNDDHNKHQKAVDITKLMIHFTMDFISMSMFETPFHSILDYDKINDDDDIFESSNTKLNQGKKILVAMTLGITELFEGLSIFHNLIPTSWNKKKRKVLKANLFLKDYISNILLNYRQNHNDEFIKSDTSIIGCLVKSPYPSDEERMADIILFFLAGHDTTGVALSWIILEVSRNPTVLKKIRKELDAIHPFVTVSSTSTVDSPSDRAKIEELQHCEYLWNVIREGLRLWPPGTTASLRVTDRDISYKQYIIPKGTSVSISNLVIMRSNITNPDKFIPERWGMTKVDSETDVDTFNKLYASEQETLNSQFLTFSLGKRICVGQQLAYLEMRLTLANLFQQFDFELLNNDSNQNISISKNNKNIVKSRCFIDNQEYEPKCVTLRPKHAFFHINKRKI